MNHTLTRTAVYVLSLAATLLLADNAVAAPPGYVVTTTSFANSPDNYTGSAALTYAPNGTLYVMESVPFGSTNRATLRTIGPTGIELPPQTVTGIDPGAISPGGMAFNFTTGQVLMTDNAPQANMLYSINPVSGARTNLLNASLPGIDDVAVRPGTGQIFISSAGPFFAVPDLGSIQLVNPVTMTATPFITSIGGNNLDFVAGLDFDPQGNLIFQQAVDPNNDFSFEGEVYRARLDAAGNLLGIDTLAVGIPGGELDLTVDADGDIFLTGGDFFNSTLGGVFKLDRDSGGNFLGTWSLFEGPDFFTGEIDALVGANPFEPFSGPNGGMLSYIRNFADPVVTNISPDFTATAAVPEASSLLGMLIGAAVLLLAGRLTRARKAAANHA